MRKNVVIIAIAIILSIGIGIGIGILVPKLQQAALPEWKKEYPYIQEADYESNMQGDKELLEEIKASGDIADISREIYHYVYYEDEKAEEQFVNDIQQYSYEVNVDTESKCILITVNSTVEEEVIRKQVLNILNLSSKYNLQYDGWETTICQ